MGADIILILDQYDLRRVGKMHVGQILECMGIIDGGVMVSHMPPAFQRREHHKQIGHAIARAFVILIRDLRQAWREIGSRISTTICFEVSSSCWRAATVIQKTASIQ